MTIYSKSKPPPGCYVYAYLRKDGTPYYIGKGFRKRAWSKGKGEIYPPSDSHRIIVIESNLTDIGALAIERRLIKWYGRKDTHTGILRNKSDGGDGACGAKRSEETKRIMSQAQKGKRIPWCEKSIIIENIRYESITIAMAVLGWTRWQINQYLTNGGIMGIRQMRKGVLSPDGIVYKNKSVAARANNVSSVTIKYWCDVEKFGWKEINLLDVEQK